MSKSPFRKGQIVSSGYLTILVTGPGRKGTVTTRTFAGTVIYCRDSSGSWPPGTYRDNWSAVGFEPTNASISRIVGPHFTQSKTA